MMIDESFIDFLPIEMPNKSIIPLLSISLAIAMVFFSYSVKNDVTELNQNWIDYNQEHHEETSGRDLMKMALYPLAVPYLLHQLWAFVAPGLYSHEKRLAAPLLVSSVMLFYCGIAFAYYVVFPLLFRFFIAVAPEGVAVMTDIGQYLDFIIAIFFAFGIAFEVPVATFLLILAGATTAESMAKKRPYIIVGAFVIGMMLTPPDVISQSLLAVPMWLLFEIGLVMSRVFIKPKERDPSHPDYQFHDDGPDSPDEDEMEAMLDEMEREERENMQRPD